MAQLSSQMLWRKLYIFSFLKVRRQRSASGQLALLIWIQTGIQSFIRAYSLTILQKLTFLYRSRDINIRSITLSYCPLFYIGSPFSIASTRPLVLVSAKRRSACSLLAIYFSPQIGWWVLKLPRSIISPLASLIAVLTSSYILIYGLSLYRLYILIIITSSPFRRTQRAIVKGPYCLRF